MREKEKNKWTERFEKLREEGLSDRQLEVVFAMLSDARVFHYAWLEVSARAQLDKLLEV